MPDKGLDVLGCAALIGLGGPQENVKAAMTSQVHILGTNFILRNK
jgi:hypothetical protein